jgi:hypothetical protein
MKLKKGEFYVIEDYIVKYTGKTRATSQPFRLSYFYVYCFQSSIGQFRITSDDLKEVKPATKMHKLLHGVE